MARSLALACLMAAIAASALSAQDLDAQTQAIASRLRCPVCQNESVADSPSELSRQMRTLIRTKLQAGESPDQIIAYFVAKYGQWIRLSRPDEASYGWSGLARLSLWGPALRWR